MSCHHPFRMWRLADQVSLRKPLSDDAVPVELPCGGCLGCRMDRARAWSIRCSLEWQEHPKSCWVTLTYRDEDLPAYGSLRKDHLSGYVKRLRARLDPERFRFFGCGEYGERTQRAHYHSILFGVSEAERHLREAWDFGNVGVHTLTPASIKYVAGYCAKKVGWRSEFGEVVDYETGEVSGRIAPFLLMSRRPGIGAASREFWRSWSRFAVLDGTRYPVPRYLHEAFKASAEPQLVEEVSFERWKHRRERSREERDASEAVARSRLSLQSDGRCL